MSKTRKQYFARLFGRTSIFIACLIMCFKPQFYDILEGMNDAIAEYVVIENRRDAIEYAIKHARKDDVVVLAGKGHEDYQILKNETIHFDEREVIRDILSNM